MAHCTCLLGIVLSRSTSLMVSRALKKGKKSYTHLTAFFMPAWWMDCKNIKKKSRWLFEIIHIIRFEIWDLRSRDLKIFLGYDINYLSIWPFMCQPWFPTRKASKLAFVCFQHQVLNTMQVLKTGVENRFQIYRACPSASQNG